LRPANGISLHQLNGLKIYYLKLKEMKQNSILFLIAVLLISCQKDEVTQLPQNLIQDDSCRIIKSYYYGGSGGIYDSADFFYNGNKLTSVISNEADVIYAYSGDKLISMHYYEKPGGLLYHSDSFFYINDTILSKIIAHDYDMYNHYDTIHSVREFNYSGNYLTRLTTVNSYEGMPDTDTLVSEFRWAGGNVNSIFSRSTTWVDDSIYYEYDNNPNYFSGASRYFFMSDPFFGLHVGFDPHLPYFISRNNVSKFIIYTNDEYPIEYQTDSLSHPIMIRSGGFDYMQYKWVCP
jgi:hypothetical protein